MELSTTKLFTTGFIQVFFVAINTVLLSKHLYLGVFIASFLISMFWTYNVKRISISTFTERMIYSLGAAVGGLAGLWTVEFLIK